MEKYHIYEEIGKGDFSQVFKGREKKRIEYVAIKRIEKSVMNKIINEVNIMHRLNNAHMLRFHDWYETKNNLWLILEYCTGGNLESILQQDGHLPEHAIRIFGSDMVAALKYLHSMGYIHGDLRPKNFLIDEYGILKLADFKFTVKIPKERLEEKPLELRGFPPYMAPELFTSEGVQSFQSDFWSLGCVLYELRRGQPPFGAANLSLDRLMNNIRSIEPIHSPLPHTSPNREGKNKATGGNIPALSAELADLLMFLLEKAPMNRCNWRELTIHPFWKPSNVTTPSNLPAQPAFDALVRELEKARSEQLEQASNAEYNLSIDDIQAYHQSLLQNQSQLPSSSSIHETPSKKILLPSVDSTPSRPEGIKSSRRNNKNTLTAANQALHTIGEETKEGFAERERTSSAALHPETETPRAMPPTPISHQQVLDIPDQASGLVKTHPSAPSSVLFHNQDLVQGHEKTTGDGGMTPLLSPHSLLLHASDTQVKPIVGNKQIESIERMEYVETTLSFHGLRIDQLTKLSQTELEVHLTQVYKALNKTVTSAQSNAVTPLVGNALTERVNILAYLCNIASSAEVANVVLNTHFLTLLLKLLKMNPVFTSTNPRLHHSPSQSNGMVSLAQVNSLHQQSRYISATVLAVMLRYATFIQPPSIRSREEHILSSLVTLLKEGSRGNDHRLRKRLTAAFGEMVFYITAQEEEMSSASASALEAANGSDAPDRWVLPMVCLELFLKCLKDDPDEIVKHYAAKTIENVMAQGGLGYRKKFVQLELGQVLLELSQTSRNDSLQGTAGMAVVHMISLVMTAPWDSEAERDSPTRSQTTPNKAKKASSAFLDLFTHPSLLQSGRFLVKLFERVNFMSFLEILKEGQLKPQQAYLNLLNALLIFPFPPSSSSSSLNSLMAVNSLSSPIVMQWIDYLSKTSLPTPIASQHQPQQTTAVSSSSLYYHESDYLQYLQDSLSPLLLLLPLSSSPSIVTMLSTAFQSLASIRHFFFQSSLSSLVPVLLRLTEQSSVNIIRAKALLTYHLLCIHQPSLLASFTDRRFPSMIVRVIEPILTPPPATAATAQQTIQSNYLLKNALSFCLFLRQSFFQSLRSLALILRALASFPSEIVSVLFHNNLNNATIFATPARGQSQVLLSDRSSSSPAVNHSGKSPASPVRSTASSAKPSPVAGYQRQCAAYLQELRASIEMIQSLLMILASPVLCRLLLTGNDLFLLEVIDCLQSYTSLKRVYLTWFASPSAAATIGPSLLQDFLGKIQEVEQSLLGTLECIAQIDLPESWDLSEQLEDLYLLKEEEEDLNQPSSLLRPFQSNGLFSLALVLGRLFPSLHELLALSVTSEAAADGQLRVLLISFIRKTFPRYCRFYFQHCLLDDRLSASLLSRPKLHRLSLQTEAESETSFAVFVQRRYRSQGYCPVSFQRQLSELFDRFHPRHLSTTAMLSSVSFFNNPKKIAESYSSFVSLFPSLLIDALEPIPQYTVRFLHDFLDLSVQIHRSETSSPSPSLRLTVIHSLLQELILSLKETGVIAQLLHLLKSHSLQLQQQMNQGDASSSSSSTAINIDPSLLLLLKHLFEWNKDIAVYLLQNDLSSSLSIAFLSSFYSILVFPFQHPELSSSTSAMMLAHPFHANIDMILALMDLVHLVLHYVLREVSAAANASALASQTSPMIQQQVQQAEHHKQSISPLKAITPALLLLSSYIDSYLRHLSAEGEGEGGLRLQDQQYHGLKLYLLESSTRCLGILFDLFSEMVTHQLLSKQSILLPQPPQSSTKTLSPRVVISDLLSNYQIEGKVLLKMMKILFGLIKVSINLNAIAKIKEFLFSEKIQEALQSLSKHLEEKEERLRRTKSTLSSEWLSIAKILQQIVEIRKSL